MKRTGAQILWECLVREGVSTVFGYPGGAILPAYDAMLDYPIRHVLVRHEQGATHMADGYARASGKVGVAIATSGPGATNMVTGMATAMMDSSPIVCITGQVGSKLIGSDGFQETDITGVTLPVTKHNYLITRAQDLAPRGPRSVPDRLEWPSRARAHRHHEGRAADLVRVRLGCRDAPAARPAGARARSGGPLGGARDDQQRQTPDDPRRPRHHPLRRHRHRSSLRRAGTDPDLDDAPRNRRHSRVASAEPRHDGHARRGVGQHRDPGSRSAAGVRHAVRRPRHRQPQDVRAECEEDPHRHRPGGDRQERQSERGPCRRPADDAGNAAARRGRGASSRMAGSHQGSEGRLRGPRHPESSRRWAPVCGARDPRHLAHDRRVERLS